MSINKDGKIIYTYPERITELHKLYPKEASIKTRFTQIDTLMIVSACLTIRGLEYNGTASYIFNPAGEYFDVHAVESAETLAVSRAIQNAGILVNTYEEEIVLTKFGVTPKSQKAADTLTTKVLEGMAGKPAPVIIAAPEEPVDDIRQVKMELEVGTFESGPIEEARGEAKEEKEKKRSRRTKAEIEAEKKKEAEEAQEIMEQPHVVETPELPPIEVAEKKDFKIAPSTDFDEPGRKNIFVPQPEVIEEDFATFFAPKEEKVEPKVGLTGNKYQIMILPLDEKTGMRNFALLAREFKKILVQDSIADFAVLNEKMMEVFKTMGYSEAYKNLQNFFSSATDKSINNLLNNL